MTDHKDSENNGSNIVPFKPKEPQHAETADDTLSSTILNEQELKANVALECCKDHHAVITFYCSIIEEYDLENCSEEEVHILYSALADIEKEHAQFKQYMRMARFEAIVLDDEILNRLNKELKSLNEEVSLKIKGLSQKADEIKTLREAMLPAHVKLKDAFKTAIDEITHLDEYHKHKDLFEVGYLEKKYHISEDIPEAIISLNSKLKSLWQDISHNGQNSFVPKDMRSAFSDAEKTLKTLASAYDVNLDAPS